MVGAREASTLTVFLCLSVLDSASRHQTLFWPFDNTYPLLSLSRYPALLCLWGNVCQQSFSPPPSWPSTPTTRIPSSRRPPARWPRAQRSAQPPIPPPQGFLWLTDATYIQPTIFHDLASEMTHVHNIMFRGLNSIYIQAPHIKPEDAAAFSHYMQIWYGWLHAHHEGEEAILFPGIERLAGEPGIMEANVTQHRSFAEGLDAFGKHCDALVAGTEKFDGQRVVQLIDVFGPTLMQHLTEEIGTLLGLERFGEEKMKDVLKIAAEEAGTVMVSPTPTPSHSLVLTQAPEGNRSRHGPTLCHRQPRPPLRERPLAQHLPAPARPDHARHRPQHHLLHPPRLVEVRLLRPPGQPQASVRDGRHDQRRYQRQCARGQWGRGCSLAG